MFSKVQLLGPMINNLPNSKLSPKDILVFLLNKANASIQTLPSSGLNKGHLDIPQELKGEVRLHTTAKLHGSELGSKAQKALKSSCWPLCNSEKPVQSGDKTATSHSGGLCGSSFKQAQQEETYARATP